MTYLIGDRWYGVGATSQKAGVATILNAKISEALKPFYGLVDNIPGMSNSDKNKLKTRPVDAILDLTNPIKDIIDEVIDIHLSKFPDPVIPLPGKVSGKQVVIDLRRKSPQDDAFAASDRDMIRRIRSSLIFMNLFAFAHPYPVSPFDGILAAVLAKHGLKGIDELIRKLPNPATVFANIPKPSGIDIPPPPQVSPPPQPSTPRGRWVDDYKEIPDPKNPRRKIRVKSGGHWEASGWEIGLWGVDDSVIIAALGTTGTVATATSVALPPVTATTAGTISVLASQQGRPGGSGGTSETEGSTKTDLTTSDTGSVFGEMSTGSKVAVGIGVVALVAGGIYLYTRK